MSEQAADKEELDYYREPEPDARVIKAHEKRSRYFLAAMSFLIALLFLSVYLNGYHDPVSGTLLLLGAIAFGIIGTLFLWRRSTLESAANIEYQDRNIQNAPPEEDTETGLREDEDAPQDKNELSLFELLVEEALAAIPDEFHERMENVFVRVQSEPGDEVLERVGIKEGYTLLGLYEGVPLTAYGQARAPYPQIITIYQRAIEAYCHGDPDRIRQQVRRTVLHEVAHHFGIVHEEMPIWVR